MARNARTLERPLEAEDYLKAAKGIAVNIARYKVQTPDGIYWNAPTNDHVDGIRVDHYFGSSGIALYLAQLYEATGDRQYADDAQAAGAYILHKIKTSATASEALAVPKVATQKTLRSADNYNPGAIYWETSAGQDSYVAFDLLQIGRILDQPAFTAAAQQIAEENVASLKRTATGAEWTGFAEILQDNGAALFLLTAAKVFDHPEWRELAVAVGDEILATEVDLGAGKARYPGRRQLLADIYDGRWQDRYYPGFTHGVAGTAYLFATLYQETGQERFLNAAVKSANLIRSIAQPFGDGKLVPLFEPTNDDPIFYVGYCHGPEGMGRLFYKLYRITGEQQYFDFYQTLIDGLIGIGVPEVHSDGYWNNFSICCGLASVLRTFNTAWQLTADERYHQYAERTTAVIMGQGYVDETDGAYRWYQAWERLTPEDIQNGISLKAGDAGLGQILLEYWATLTHNPDFHVIRRPEDPYPA